MRGLTLSTKEQSRLQTLNGVLARYWSMQEVAPLLGVSERQGWRLLAAYRKDGAAALAHKNRGRVPSNATPETIQQRVAALAQGRYGGINHTQLTELLAERDAGVLVAGWAFLQRLSSRLRIVENRSISDFDETQGTLESLAGQMGYPASAGGGRKSFLRDYREHTDAIRGVYDRILKGSEPGG